MTSIVVPCSARGLVEFAEGLRGRYGLLSQELSRLMAANGGSLRNFYLTDVTHVVAEVLTNQQV